MILELLCEGNTIRGRARLIKVSPATVLKLIKDSGRECMRYERRKYRNLVANSIQCDEIWSYVHTKRKHLARPHSKRGDQWTWIAMDTRTRFILSWHVGTRHVDTGNEFLTKLASGGCSRDTNRWTPRRTESSWDTWRRLGAQFDVLRGGEIGERFPDLAAPETDSGVLDLRAGYSEPHQYVPALRAKLEDMGVEIRENEAVVGFERSGDRVRGVVTDRGAIEADATVCAVNAWTNQLLSLVGFRTPHKNFVH